MRRLILIVPILAVTYTVQSPAFGAGNCKLLPEKYFSKTCKFFRTNPFKPDQLRASEIRNSENAARSSNEITTEIVNVQPQLGYSVVKYSFVDREKKSFSLPDSTIQNYANRSVLDWLKSIFVTEGRSFLISIDVYSDDAEKNLIAHKPIYAAVYKDGLASVHSDTSISLNGQVGYFRKSDENHRVRLTVRYANNKDVTIENIKQIIATAGRAASFTTSFNSLVKAASIPDYNKNIGLLNNHLQRFSVSEKMSVSITLKNVEGSTSSFLFDFRAPSETELPRIKLNVSLDYVPSLLVRGGGQSPYDVLSRTVHKDNVQIATVEEFIEQHPKSRDQIVSLSGSSANVELVCERIKSALRERFIARDVSTALNAYVATKRSTFRKHWDPMCFNTEDRIQLVKAGIDITDLGTTQNPIPKSVELTLHEQTPLIETVSSFGTKNASGNSVVDFSSNHSSVGEIDVVDKFGFVLDAGSISRIAPFELATIMLKSNSTFEQSLRCYSGDRYETPQNPNVVGTLTSVNGKPIEVVFHYETAPKNRSNPKLKKLEFLTPTEDVLIAYRDAAVERKINGCKDGFSPWKSD